MSFGDDGISSYFLKLVMPFIKDSLVYLFNASLETSQFPDPRKITRVSSIFRDGSKTESLILSSLVLENFIPLLRAYLKTLMTGTTGWIQGIWRVWSLQI